MFLSDITTVIPGPSINANFEKFDCLDECVKAFHPFYGIIRVLAPYIQSYNLISCL